MGSVDQDTVVQGLLLSYQQRLVQHLSMHTILEEQRVIFIRLQRTGQYMVIKYQFTVSRYIYLITTSLLELESRSTPGCIFGMAAMALAAILDPYLAEET